MSRLKWKKPKGVRNKLENRDNDVKMPFEEEEKNTGAEQVTEAAASEAQTENTQTGAENADTQQPADISEWEDALRKAVAQRDEYLALAQRTQADFSNFRRRNQTVRTDALDEGARETLAAFLPVKDNFERALAAIGEDEASSPLADGVRMIYKQFVSICEKRGMEEIPSEPGTPFDPEMHNAVMRGEGGEPDTILECFEKGYKVKDKIIRYASVKVSAE